MWKVAVAVVALVPVLLLAVWLLRRAETRRIDRWNGPAEHGHDVESWLAGLASPRLHLSAAQPQVPNQQDHAWRITPTAEPTTR